jgi:hypothetical protein
VYDAWIDIVADSVYPSAAPSIRGKLDQLETKIARLDAVMPELTRQVSDQGSQCRQAREHRQQLERQNADRLDTEAEGGIIVKLAIAVAVAVALGG